MKVSAYVFSLLALANFGVANAGIVEGPYVVWVNLQQIDEALDAKVRQYLNSGDDLCWNKDARMYMRKLPTEVNKNLIKRAILQKNQKAKAQLLSVLHQPFDEVPSFDGIIVATHTKQSITLVSMDALGHLKEDEISDATKQEAIKASLCLVMPPIRRTP